MTWPPSASIRAAAAITSITMNGGTSLRPDAVSSCLTRSLSVASRIDICYLTRCPRLAAFHGLLGAYIVSDPPPMDKDHPMPLRTGLRKKMAKLTALATAAALAVAPMSALAEEQKGPPVISDAEAEQLLRDYTRPI